MKDNWHKKAWLADQENKSPVLIFQEKEGDLLYTKKYIISKIIREENTKDKEEKKILIQ